MGVSEGVAIKQMQYGGANAVSALPVASLLRFLSGRQCQDCESSGRPAIIFFA